MRRAPSVSNCNLIVFEVFEVLFEVLFEVKLNKMNSCHEKKKLCLREIFIFLEVGFGWNFQGSSF